MELTDRSGAVVFASKSARRIDPADAKALSGELDELTNGDVLLRSSRITGGFIIWAENISAVEALRRRLTALGDELSRSNALLRREYDIRKKAGDARAARLIEDELEKLLSDKLELAKNMVAGRDAISPSELSFLSFIICYCKRRTGFLFREKELSRIAPNELGICLDELAAQADGFGVTAAVSTALLGDIYMKDAAVCYDLLFEGIKRASELNAGELIYRVQARGSDIVLRLLTEEPLGIDGKFRGVDVELESSGYLSSAVVVLKEEAAP